MGNPKRWFVDNGSKQGFLPADILNPIGDEDMKAIHAYDDVAEEESVDAKIDETEVNAMENNSSEILSKPEENACHESTTANNTNNDDSKENDNKKQQIPVRKAPPVPSSQQKQRVLVSTSCSEFPRLLAGSQPKNSPDLKASSIEDSVDCFSSGNSGPT